VSDELTIGRLAAATSTSVETIRWYEKVGLLRPPQRTGGNYRRYSRDDLARLSFIRRSRELGFSIVQVRALLDLSDDRSQDCATVDVIASAHLREIDRKITDLTALRRELSGLVTSCKGGTVAQCRILEALAPIG
jgi:Cu(I)-responsive transcriptional regulator